LKCEEAKVFFLVAKFDTVVEGADRGLVILLSNWNEFASRVNRFTTRGRPFDGCRIAITTALKFYTSDLN
jgi:hypothetical protein